jgi:hypothetical protein
VGEPVPEPQVRGDRRTARLSRRLRQPPRQRGSAATTAPPRSSSWPRPRSRIRATSRSG